MILFCIMLGICGLLFMPFGVLANGWKGALVALLIAAGISGALTADYEHKKTEWNGGYCDCGTHWELRGASKGITRTETKYYVCPNCYAEIRQ